MRVPERLAGETWVVGGWCGRLCECEVRYVMGMAPRSATLRPISITCAPNIIESDLRAGTIESIYFD